MNQQEAAALRDVFNAFADGKEVQVRPGPDQPWIKALFLCPIYGAGAYRIAPAKVRVKGWLNVYPCGSYILHVHGLCATRAEADHNADPHRIACIEIDVEGERLG